MSLVVFNTNHEAELLGECVPKPELGNEESVTKFEIFECVSDFEFHALNFSPPDHRENVHAS